MNSFTEEQIETTRKSIMEGLEITILGQQKELLELSEGMTQKQLRKALKTFIKYPELPNPKDLTERELKFNATILTLSQARVQYEINVLADLQKERDQKNNQQGENNG